ncbi:hypothetical protein COCNU_03G007560 [Cocos nucifera]|uniref:Uncharacterized protein n=1 Tax=Cocos nucifera TaxID=13894 RepID=A0A8K0I2G0_COCNU|nr:hypothetical protein COCNU_03G007560 [Cocos nucifera]
MPCAGKACSASSLDGGLAPVVRDGCSSYGGVGSLVHGGGSSPGCPRIGDVCAGSGSFCFLSTLTGFLAEEDCCQKLSLEASQSSAQPGNVLAYKMSNGGVVSCTSVDASSGIHDQLRSEGRNIDGDGIASCKAPLVPDVWIRASSALTVELDDHAEDIDLGLNNGYSSPHVEINPPMLDWGTSNLYSPSLAFLTVTNRYNDSVLQTSFGGFIIHAKGIAVESPYKIESLVGLDISLDERLNRNLSLQNPFDDVLYVEEVTTWISSSGNSNRSALVICSVDGFQQSSNEFDSSLNDKESFAVKPDELGLSWVDVRPHEKWEVLPHNTETIIGIKLWPHLEGKFFGVICMKLRDTKQDKTDMVIIPLELEVHGRGTCIELTGAVSVFFEPLVPSIRKGLKPEAVCGHRYPICQDGLHDSPKAMQVKQDSVRPKKTPFSSPTSTRKPVEFLESDMPETPQNGNLTIRIVKEKGRRRKRKTTGAGLAAKFEVSSSQSGNSTPSSPLTPNANTPKQVWSLSLDTTNNPFSGVSEEQKHQKKHDVDVPMEVRVTEAEKHGDNTWLLSAQEQPPLTAKSTGRSTLLPSATFPSPSRHAPGLAVPSFLAKTSPIAPHARAPGSKLGKDKAVQRKQNDVLGEEFTYDIWGNHFSDQLLGRSKEFTSKVLDASEGDSQSFFAKDPQSLMMMSSAQSASPGHKWPSYDVTGLHQKN